MGRCGGSLRKINTQKSEPSNTLPDFKQDQENVSGDFSQNAPGISTGKHLLLKRLGKTHFRLRLPCGERMKGSGDSATFR